MDIYKLNRAFWDFAFDNPSKIKPTHVAVYQFAIEHCNRLGWKQEFGFPTSMVLDAIGIKSYSVYKSVFDDLVSYGFFRVVQYSKNQWSSNIIALKENNKANYKALDKALIKHTSKQHQSTYESTHQSTDSIDIPIYNSTNIPIYQSTNLQLVIAFCQTLPDEEINLLSSSITDGTFKNYLKRKKVAPKKESDELDHPEEYWTELVSVWNEFYKSKYEDTPKFDAISGKNLKSILKNLKTDSMSKGFQWDLLNAKNCLSVFLELAYKNPWLKQNFLLKNLASQYDSIKTSKNGSYKTGKVATGGEVDTKSAFDKIDKMFAKYGN